MMNWPTAFVIAVAICAVGFLYNKPSDAALGGSDRGFIALDGGGWLQFDGSKKRYCYRYNPGIDCDPWYHD